MTNYEDDVDDDVNVDAETGEFFDLLSGKIEYSVQWEAWERLCQEHEVNPVTAFAVLGRAYKATR